jgi:hypothetical protein
MQMTDWQNQSNLANTQMQNSYNMYNANQQAAQSNAMNQNIMGGLGAFAQGWGQYAANKPQSTTGLGANQPKVSATGWDTGNPEWKWE